MVPWPINPGNDLIQIKLPQNTPKCRSQGISSKPGQCFPLQIKFTDKGKKFTSGMYSEPGAYVFIRLGLTMESDLNSN